MYIKQISIWTENKPDRLSEVTKILSEIDINIRTISIVDIDDSGILRLITDKPDLAKHVLEEKGFKVASDEVLGVCVEQIPDDISFLLESLGDSDIAIEYMYVFGDVIILRLNKQEEALSILKRHNMKLFI